MKKTLSDRGVFERKVSEEDVLQEITIRLRANGARVFRVVERIPWGKTTSTPGIPDLYVVIPTGRIEVKESASL